MAQGRSDNRLVLEELRDKIDKVHDRVYNGLGKDIREEVSKELAGVRQLVIGILVALLLSLTGIIIEGRMGSSQSSSESDRNYKAIVDIGTRLDNHILQTVGKQ